MSSNPSGIDCGLECTATLDYGTVVTLIASADIGSTFTGWDDACTNKVGNCVVIMTQARSVTATFTLVEIEYKIFMPIITR